MLKRSWLLLAALVAASPAIAIPPPPLPPAPPGVTFYSDKDLTGDPTELARRMTGEVAGRMVEYRAAERRFYGKPKAADFGVCEVESLQPALTPDGARPPQPGLYVAGMSIGKRYTRVVVPKRDWPATQAACGKLGPGARYFDGPSPYAVRYALELWDQTVAGAGKPGAYRISCNIGKACDARATVARMASAEVTLVDWVVPAKPGDPIIYRIYLQSRTEGQRITLRPARYRGPPTMSEPPVVLAAVHIGV